MDARKIVAGSRSSPMANLLDMDIIFTKKLRAIGYVLGDVVKPNPFFDGSFKGHEFHYSYALPDNDVEFAFKTDLIMIPYLGFIPHDIDTD